MYVGDTYLLRGPLPRSLDQSTTHEYDINPPAAHMTFEYFDCLRFLTLRTDGRRWANISLMLSALPSSLAYLCFNMEEDELERNDRLVEDGGELKTMRMDGLELLDPVLEQENFKELADVTFTITGYQSVLDPLRDRTLKYLRGKLPKLHKRGSDKIVLLHCYIYKGLEQPLALAAPPGVEVGLPEVNSTSVPC